MNVSERSKLLLKLSLDEDGFLNSERVKGVCAYIETRTPETAKIPLLKEYLKRVKNLSQKQSAVIETSGELSAENLDMLSSKIRNKLGAKAGITVLKNPNLIGGVKIKCGDDVFECSIASQLDALK